jgi:hypothetical protein
VLLKYRRVLLSELPPAENGVIDLPLHFPKVEATSIHFGSSSFTYLIIRQVVQTFNRGDNVFSFALINSKGQQFVERGCRIVPLSGEDLD